MSPADSKEDPSFVVLPTRLRRRIDGAFDSTVSQWQQTISPGGFVPEDSAAGPSQPGGFIVEDVSANTVFSSIPLSEIPRALSLLDVCPDDDLMGVFENAATGWGAQNACNDGVNRRDWRAICAALLEGGHDGRSDEEEDVDADVEMGVDSSPDSDEYQTEELSGDPEEDSGDEDEERGQTIRRPESGRAHNVGRKSTAGAKSSRQLSESQKAQCRQDFGRFFPHVPDSELDQQRLMIRDIIRVAGLLKENLKADEMVEMLEAFSTSPDKSVNLADFERMMMVTKLV